MTWLQDASRTARVVPAGPGESGLRRAQVGAAWAIAAAFTSGRPAAALAVLPTGTGKSAVLALVPLLVPPAGPVLVAAPSRIVRDQLRDELETQRTLRAAGVLPPETPPPSVAVVEHRLKSEQEWREAAEGADFVVGTLGVLSPGHSGVADPPAGLFGMVLVDEAHHSPAATWAALLAATSHAHRALVTATPVRSDRVEVPADLVYSYRLKDALRDGVIEPVTFVPVVVPDGTGRDEALAAAAAARLARPEHVAGRSLLLVRTGSIDDARALKDVYAAAGIALGVVTSRTSPTAVRAAIRAAEDGALQGLVTVGVLGEGFDLPRVKIAVYHRKHQSLAATLQFAGRVARQGEKLGPAELLAIPGEDVAAETRELYEDDDGWSSVLAGLSDAALEDERERRAFLGGLRDMRRAGILPEPLSPAAVRVARDVIVFRIDPAAHARMALDAPVLRVAHGDVVLDRMSPDRRMRVLVTVREERPGWLTSHALDTELHTLHVAVLDPVSPLLFIRSASDTTARQVAAALGAATAEPEDTGWIARFLAGLKVTSYFSVGMRATRMPGGTLATYRTLAGTSVGTAVTATDSIAYAAGHLILVAAGPFGGTASTSVGVSVRRAKVWSPGSLDLMAFRRWCERVGALGRTAPAPGANAPHLGLRIPQPLTKFPQRPIAALPDSRLLQGQPQVRTAAGLVPIEAVELIPTRKADDRLHVVGTCGGVTVLDAETDLSGRLTSTVADPGTGCLLPNAVADVPLIDALEGRTPLTYYYADASSSIGAVLYSAPPAAVPFPPARLAAVDWTGVDIRRESKSGRGGLINVQDAMTAWHALQQPAGHLTVVVNDDGSGEIADLVVVTLPPAAAPLADPAQPALTPAQRAAALATTDTVRVTLCHCKHANSDNPRRDLTDLDQLVGQAHRSARWLLNPTAFWKELARRLGGRAAVTHGDPSLFKALAAAWSADPPTTAFDVQIVQPGLAVAQVAGWPGGETLLSFCHDSLADTGAGFGVIGA
jgi:superfamily II DNA or RNA helicase